MVSVKELLPLASMCETSLSCLKKDQTNEGISATDERYSSYFAAYTDGSKCEQNVAEATFYPKDPDKSGAV